jgi:hypothetical protein
VINGIETSTLHVEWIRSLISFLDRIYRVNGIFFRLRREECPSAEGLSIQTSLSDFLKLESIPQLLRYCIYETIYLAADFRSGPVLGYHMRTLWRELRVLLTIIFPQFLHHSKPCHLVIVRHPAAVVPIDRKPQMPDMEQIFIIGDAVLPVSRHSCRQ